MVLSLQSDWVRSAAWVKTLHEVLTLSPIFFSGLFCFVISNYILAEGKSHNDTNAWISEMISLNVMILELVSMRDIFGFSSNVVMIKYIIALSESEKLRYCWFITYQK